MVSVLWFIIGVLIGGGLMFFLISLALGVWIKNRTKGQVIIDSNVNGETEVYAEFNAHPETFKSCEYIILTVKDATRKKQSL